MGCCLPGGAHASHFAQNATLLVNERDGDPGADDRCRQDKQPAVRVIDVGHADPSR